MGKSYRKTPIVKDNQKASKYLKNVANRKVRRSKKGISNGKGYRKIFNPWDIHDDIFRYSEASFWRNYHNNFKEFLNVKERSQEEISEYKKKEYTYTDWKKDFYYK